MKILAFLFFIIWILARYNISEKLSKGFEYIRAELNKCILLCINCHKIVHKTMDPNYFIINNYFFSNDFENLSKNVGVDNNNECTTLELEKGIYVNGEGVIPW